LRLRALAIAAALVLTGCTNAELDVSLPPNTDPADQDLVWVPCDEDFECAKIASPLDWTEDTGEFLNIKLMRSAGTAELEPILINPGGPGSSAVKWMRDNYEGIGSDWLRANFQVIAFDPRGVGESTAVTCHDEELKDRLYYGIPEFEFGSEEDIAYSEQVLSDFAASCQESGPNLGYFNTQQTARDMDLIRQLMGLDQLNYIGFSYGTELGSVYTALFPSRVGKFVLDGAIDPTMDENTKLLGQVSGFDKALRAYLADCLSQSFCPFSGDVDSAMAQISGFMQAREVRPLPTDGDRELGVSATLAGIIVTLYSKASWSYLTQALSDAFAGDGTLMLWLADFYNDRDPDGGYVSNINEANYAINCADAANHDDGPDLEQEIMNASVVFGKYFAYPMDTCIGWPEGIGMQELDFTQPLSNGPLVIGTTGDPATPYEQAVTLSGLLDGAKLLTLRGEGHTAYGTSSCIDSLVDAYLEGIDLGEGSLSCF
jgi:pimeloyl-ACP methyl ester carboxylesterase